MQPRQVDDGGQAAHLQVDQIAAVALARGADLAEKADRRPHLQRVRGQVGQEQAVAARGLEHLAAQPFQQRGIAVHGAQVEEHAGEHQRLGLGRAGPAPEQAAPGGDRLPPGVGARHHLARAVDVAAGVEPVVDEAGEFAEVAAVRAGVVAVGHDQGVVLVGARGLLLPGLAAGRHPHIGHGRRAERRLGQLQQPDGGGIGDGRHHLARGAGAGVGGHQVAQQLGHGLHAAGQAGHVLLAVQRGGQVHGRAGQALLQVGVRDEADGLVAIEHRHVVDAVAGHGQQRLEGRRVGLRHLQPGRGDGLHRQGRVGADGEHAVAQVAVGGDAAQPAAGVDQQHRGHAMRAHARRGLGHRGAGADRDRRVAQQAAQRLRHQRGVGVARSLAPGAGQLGREQFRQLGARLGGQRLPGLAGLQQRLERGGAGIGRRRGGRARGGGG